jgi:hypothetical protein
MMRATAKPNACSHRQNPLPAAAWGIIADTIPLTLSLDFIPDIWSRRRFQGKLVAIEGDPATNDFPTTSAWIDLYFRYSRNTVDTPRRTWDVPGHENR